MPNYTVQQLATLHNSLPPNHEEFRQRQNLVNNTPHFYSGNLMCHLKTIQMVDIYDFYALFGNFELPYALQAINFFQGDNDVDPGDLEISLMMERDFRAPGSHLAVFLIHLFPHRQFYDGHVFQMEFDEGSFQHQTIERLFDIRSHGIIEQATQYQILSYIAEEDEMLNLLHLFLVGFNPMKFSFDGENYFVDPEAENNHRPHACCDNEIERIMRGFQEIDQLAGADAEINQGFVDEDDFIYINDYIPDYRIYNNVNNYNVINYPAYEPDPEQNFRVQG
jgi:hypothetical protein